METEIGHRWRFPVLPPGRNCRERTRDGKVAAHARNCPCSRSLSQHPVFLGSEQPQKPPIFRVSHTLRFHTEKCCERGNHYAKHDATDLQFGYAWHILNSIAAHASFPWREVLDHCTHGHGAVGEVKAFPVAALEKALPGEHYPSTTCHAFVESVSQIILPKWRK